MMPRPRTALGVRENVGKERPLKTGPARLAAVSIEVAILGMVVAGKAAVTIMDLGVAEASMVPATAPSWGRDTTIDTVIPATPTAACTTAPM